MNFYLIKCTSQNSSTILDRTSLDINNEKKDLFHTYRYYEYLRLHLLNTFLSGQLNVLFSNTLFNILLYRMRVIINICLAYDNLRRTTLYQYIITYYLHISRVGLTSTQFIKNTLEYT